MKKSNIYTKTGDSGKTSLIGGTRVSKGDIRLEAYGTIDELNCHLGMIRSYPMDAQDHDFIIFIQKKFFSAAGNLATDQSVFPLKDATIITEEDIESIEDEIDRLDNLLPPLNHFIIPGGDPQISACHIARTVTRRCERAIVRLSEIDEIDEHITIFFNRVSDYLFVLGRKLSQDHNFDELSWIPS
ncbi:cob(I)yrinic acid a,c-diamide adenosyltransferase [Saccharicrinis sp. FJH2]|uniref:cob(I)yrinic acid a,c-diamide adenosyltransferase n=1 Tax=Saccharicrinis sp. FJH65 TaxID=3344659 RepID=UPI0035F26819